VSVSTQGRQYLTNIVQIVLPLLIIVLLYAIQLLVTSVVQSLFGKYTPAHLSPQTVANNLYFPLPNETAGCSDNLTITVEKFRLLQSGIDVGQPSYVSDGLIDFYANSIDFPKNATATMTSAAAATTSVMSGLATILPTTMPMSTTVSKSGNASALSAYNASMMSAAAAAAAFGERASVRGAVFLCVSFD
jgi:hypothetical protein